MTRTPSPLAPLLLLAAFVGAPASAQQGGIEFFSGETLGEGIWRASAFYAFERRDRVYRGSERVRNPQDLRLHRHTTTFAVDYGLLPELTLNAQLPVRHNELRVRDATTGEIFLRGYGLGDAAISAKYRLAKSDWKQGALHVSAMLGLELPTADVSQRDEGVRLPPPAQPGTGSWDPFAALTINSSFGRLRLDAHVLYRLVTKNRYEFDDGDVFLADAAVAYRYWHAKYPGPTASAKLALRVVWQDRQSSDGREVRDSGSTRVLLRPGLGFHPIPRMDLNVTGEIPIYQHFGGVQLANGWRVIVAFGLRF